MRCWLRTIMLFVLAGMVNPVAGDTLAELPIVLVDGPVYATAVKGNTLYIGGDFNNISNVVSTLENSQLTADIQVTPIRSLAAIDLASRTLLREWQPVQTENIALGPVIVRALEVDRFNNRLIVGGEFESLGVDENRVPVPRNGLAAVHINEGTNFASGDVDVNWQPSSGQVPPAVPAVIVHDLAWSADESTLYVAGDFTEFAGQLRSHLAGLDISTASLRAWNPAPDGVVRSVLRSADGGSLYVGGDFNAVGGQIRPRLAQIGLASGFATPWRPDMVGTSVHTMIGTQDRLYVGGDFSQVSGLVRNGLVAFDISSGAGDILPAWNPDVAGHVNALALSRDETALYFGGLFSTVNGSPRNNLAMVRAQDGALQAWAPETDTAPGNEVWSLRVNRLNWLPLQDTGLPDDTNNIQYDYVLAGARNTHTIFTLPAQDNFFSAYIMEPPTVTASPAAGGYKTAQNVALSCTDHEGTDCSTAIYYSLDGSEPTSPYSTDLNITVTTRLRYVGVDQDGVRSAEHDVEYAIDNEPPASSASLPGGVYGIKNFVPIELSCSDSGDAGCSAIHYTLDGSEPDTSSPVYDPQNPITFEGDTTVTLKFFAVDRAGNQESVKQSENYTIDLIPPEVIVSNAGGNYSGSVTVDFRCPDEDCTRIYYTLDGESPYERGTLGDLEPLPSETALEYTGPFVINKAGMLRVLTFDDVGNVTSAIAGVYTFTDPNPETRSGVGGLGLFFLLFPGLIRLLRALCTAARISDGSDACR